MSNTQAVVIFLALMLVLLAALAATSNRFDTNEVQVLGIFGTASGFLLKSLTRK
jgi:hypothetical protein